MERNEIEELIEWHDAEANRLADRSVPNVYLDKHQRSARALRHLLQAQTWRPISENEAPHDEWLLLAEPPQSYETRWNLKVGKASWGQRPGERGWAGYASHWMTLPQPPSTDEEPKATPSEQQGTNDHDTD